MHHRLSVIIRRMLPHRAPAQNDADGPVRTTAAKRGSAEPAFGGLGVAPQTGPSQRHGIMFALDIAGFGRCDPYVQRALRAALYRIVQTVCADHGVSWNGTYNEDRGDGFFFITDTAVLPHLEDLAIGIAIELRKHNRSAEPAHRFAVRMSIHAGYLQHDEHGVISSDVILLHRLLEAPVLKELLTDATTGFALIISDGIYQVTAPNRMIERDQYQRVTVQVKETDVNAWILRLPLNVS